MATVTELFIASRKVVNLFLMVAVFILSDAGSHLLPLKRTDGVVQPRQEGCIADLSDSVKVCLRPLDNLQRPSGGLHLEEVVSPEGLEAACRKLITAEYCVSGVFNASCGPPHVMTPHVNISIQTTFGVVGYMCSKQGTRLLRSEQRCWQTVDMNAVFDSCYGNLQFNSGDVCGDVQEMRSCLRDRMVSVCSKRAARFVDRVVFYGVEPIARQIFHCDVRLINPVALSG